MKTTPALILLTILFSCGAASVLLLAGEHPPRLKGPYLGQDPPGTEPKLFAPGLVSTPEGIEFGLSVSPDGKEIYFTRFMPGAAMAVLSSHLEPAGWTKLRESAYFRKYQATSPRFSPEGRSIYFTSHRPGGREGRRMEKPVLLLAHRESAGWSIPRNAGLPDGWVSAQWNPMFAADGYLYFNGRVQGGPARFDDLVRARLEEGGYAEVERLMWISREDAMDAEPEISPDGSYLLFYSAGRPGNLSEEMLGDLWVSFRQQDGDWSAPRNLGERVNSRAEENWPRFSPDGKYIFFSSNRNRENGFPDIYWVSAEVVEALRPERQ